MKLLKKLILFCIASALMLNLAACSNVLSQHDLTEITAVTGCRFSVPAKLKQNSASYRDFTIAVSSGDYALFEDCFGNELCYSNMYQLIDLDNTFSCAVYCPKTSVHLSSVTAQTAPGTIRDLLSELTFELHPATEEQEAVYYGIDTNTEFYTNMVYDTENAVLDTHDTVQKYTIPFQTSFSQQVESIDSGAAAAQVNVSGYVALITAGDQPTQMMMVYQDDTAGYPIGEMIESFQHDDSVAGIDAVFDAAEVLSIESDSLDAMNEAIKQMDD